MKKEERKKIKKIFFALLILLLISIIIFILVSQKTVVGECQKDADCVLQQISCCPCEMGGEEACMSRENAIYSEQKLRECPENIVCIALYNCKIKACKCEEGKCISVSEEENKTALPNPASVYCIEQGGTLEIREDEQRNQYGVCIFPQGECEEWAFYRGECKPGESLGK